MLNPYSHFGHIYLFCKGWYKVDRNKVSDELALSRIIAKACLIDDKYVNVKYVMLQIAIHHLLQSNNPEYSIFEFINNTNPESSSYKLREYSSYSHAVINEAKSIIYRLNVEQVGFQLPVPTPEKFFTLSELILDT